MNIELKSTHKYSLDEKTREYINKKVSRLDHVKDHVADLHITIDRETHGEYNAESNIHFRWGTMSHIGVRNRDLDKAIDLLFDKLEIKATKEKNKIQSHP